MKTEEIQKEWSIDSKIDDSRLDLAALDCSALHSKYYGYLLHELRFLKAVKEDYKKELYLKHEYYVDGGVNIQEEMKERGWEPPPRIFEKRDMKSVERLMSQDKDIRDFNLKIGFYEDKIEFLRSIISMISFRNNNIRSAIDWRRYTSKGEEQTID